MENKKLVRFMLVIYQDTNNLKKLSVRKNLYLHFLMWEEVLGIQTMGGLKDFFWVGVGKI